MAIDTILLILALICFVLASLKVEVGNGPSLTPLGLVFWVATLIF